MKQKEIIKNLSLTYWQVYTEQLYLADYAKKLHKQGCRKASRAMAKRARKAEYTLEGIMLSAVALGVGLEELQSASDKAMEGGTL